MRKFVATFLLLLAISFPVFSQVLISEEDRVENRSPGYCVWCCLETLGRHHGIKELDNLVSNRQKEFTWQKKGEKWVKSPYVWVDYGNYRKKEHRSPGSPRAVANKLRSLNVKFRYQDYGNYSRSLIKRAIKEKKGCVIVVYWWKSKDGKKLIEPGTSTHGIILLDYNDKGVRFLDPNHTGYTYSANHAWFRKYWTGYAIVLE